MNDEEKTEARLINELVALRQRVADLEAAETEAKRAEEAARALAQVGRDLSQSLDPEEVGQRIADSLLTLFSAQVASLYEAESESGNLVALTVSGDVGPTSGRNLVFVRGTGLIGIAVREGQPVVTLNVLTDSRISLTPEMRARIEQAPFGALLAAPLLVKDRVIGGFVVGDRVGRVFTDEEIQLARAFGDQAARALENARFYEGSQRRQRETTALLSVAQTFDPTLDYHEIVRRTVREVTLLFQADTSIFFEVGEMSEHAVPVAGYHVPTALRDQRYRMMLTNLPPFIIEAWNIVGPVASSDVPSDPRFDHPAIRIMPIQPRSLLYVPVLSKRGVLGGLLSFWWTKSHRFTEEELELAARVADQMALVFDNAQLYVQHKEAQTLLTVSQAASSTPDLTERMRRVAREISQALGADMAGAFLADPAQESLRPIAGYHVPKHLLKTFMKFPIPLKGHRAVEEAWEDHRPTYSSDAEADPRIDREIIRRFPQRSVLFVPMIVKGEPIGGFFITWWERKHQFTPEELRLVEGISRQAAIALENARLFQGTEQRWREAEAYAMLLKDLSDSLEPDVVLARLVEEVKTLSQADFAYLVMVDGDGESVTVRTQTGRSSSLLAGLTLEKGKGMAGKVLDTGEAVVSDGYLADPQFSHEYDTVARTVGTVAQAAVPIVHAGRTLGILLAARRRPVPFTSQDVKLLSSLADAATLAIKNAQLYDQDRKRAQHALEERERALRILAGKLLSAQEEERRRVARELHDDLTQQLAVLAIETGKLEQRLPSSRKLVRDGLRGMKDEIVRLSAEVHRISRQLHPSILDDLGLVAAIESECGGFSAREGIAVEFTQENVPEGLPKDVALCLYRITQEGLRNIAKHAQTGKAQVTLAGIDGVVRLSVQDSGIGFDPAQGRGKGGLGLAGMAERVRLVRGNLSVQSRPGQGTTIEAWTPLAERDG